MATAVATRPQQADPVTVFRQTISQPAMREQIRMALPTHISVEKFERVATTAVQTNPDLLNPSKVERRSLFGALVKAAQDGLLPDGREGAIVPFKGKAQWMPMVAGIMKKVRNSGEIAGWDVVAVYEKDKFQRLLGDDMRIYHEPCEDQDPGQVTGAYSIVTFKDGTRSKDYLPRWRIEKARNQNPMGKNSLMWTQFYDEGACKTVIRHHAKRLPQSTDIEAAFERDDTMRHIEHEPPAMALVDETPASRLDRLEQHIDATAEPGPDDEPDSQTNDADAIEPIGTADEGPADEQRGEVVTLESAKAEIARQTEVREVNRLVKALTKDLNDDAASELRIYAAERCETILRSQGGQ
jgi:recombination protein RecT